VLHKDVKKRASRNFIEVIVAVEKQFGIRCHFAGLEKCQNLIPMCDSMVKRTSQPG
jgi:phosphopantetheine adenylyltransferase